MVITIHNHRDLSNKWIRRIKYLLYKLKEKFDQICYSDVYIQGNGSDHQPYSFKIIVGLPGQDIVYRTKAIQLNEDIKKMYNNLKRTLSKRLGRDK